jgi:hypothetical protein
MSSIEDRRQHRALLEELEGYKALLQQLRRQVEHTEQQIPRFYGHAHDTPKARGYEALKAILDTDAFPPTQRETGSPHG